MIETIKVRFADGCIEKVTPAHASTLIARGTCQNKVVAISDASPLILDLEGAELDAAEGIKENYRRLEKEWVQHT